MRPRRLIWFPVLLCLVACGSPGVHLAASAVTPTATPILYCSTKEGKKVGDLVGRYAREWDDANKLAGAGSRMTLSPQVADLQRIRREVAAQDYPECGQRAQRFLIDSMDSTINGYIAFLKQEPDYITTGYFRTASGLMDRFGTALVELNGPLLSPTAGATPAVTPTGAPLPTLTPAPPATPAPTLTPTPWPTVLYFTPTPTVTPTPTNTKVPIIPTPTPTPGKGFFNP